MKGGVIPSNCQELQKLINIVGKEYGGGFPIQSQHEGNCASDAIQIILFFSDGIGMRFSTFAIERYQSGSIGDIYDETTLEKAVKPGVNLDALAITYGQISIVRFLRLIDEYRERIRVFNARLARAPSRGRSIGEGEMTRLPTPIGVACSSVFAVAQRSIPAVGEITNPSLVGERNLTYGYTSQIYDPIVNGVLQRVAPGSLLISGTLSKVPNSYNVPQEMTTLSPYQDRIVGVQLFCLESTGRRGFHTFSLFKRGGRWYIGDNEVGISIPITFPNFSTREVANGRISFEAVSHPKETLPGGKIRWPYTRTYYHHTVQPNLTLGPPVQLAKVEYYLPAHTSGSYAKSYEDVMNMSRKYFIAPEGAPPCPGPTGGRTRRRRSRFSRFSRKRTYSRK